MYKLLRILFLGSVFIALPAFSATHGVVGFWKTIDDHTHKPRSIVEIYEKDSKIFGKIVKVFPHEGNKDLCEVCPDDFKNKPILGLQFMWDLKPAGQNLNKYEGGKILDPSNGSIYRSKIALAKDGKTLEVRGYIGISLFGRSQTWERVDNYDASAL